jgi:methionyl-tRNA formyltransferase
MRIGLFAHGEVGLEVVRHFTAGACVPVLIVLARGDDAGNAAIRRAANTAAFAEWGRVPDAAQLEQWRAAAPELGIAAWWPFILRPEVFTVPRLGCLNFHPSLLPHGRGKHPNFWALREGTPFGVSLQFIDAGVDSGAVAFQQELPVSWEDTGGTLHRRAQEAIVSLFKANFARIVRGDIPRRPQTPGAGSFHRARELEPASEIRLDDHCSARELLNLLRARTYPPHPAAWFTECGEVYDVRVEIKKRPSPLPHE